MWWGERIDFVFGSPISCISLSSPHLGCFCMVSVLPERFAAVQYAMGKFCPIRGCACKGVECAFFVATDVGGFAHREKRFGCAVALLPEFIKRFAGV